MKRESHEEKTLKMKLRTARLVLISTIIGCVTTSIGIISYFKPWDTEEQAVVETKISTQNNQEDSLLVVQNIPVSNDRSYPEKVGQDFSNNISALIRSFDQSQSDFINTRIIDSHADTLSDGTLSRKRIPRLSTKTSEEAYLEMESAHTHLVSFLESKGLTSSYKAVLISQKEKINHAYSLFQGNMGSPLFGIESSVAEGI